MAHTFPGSPDSHRNFSYLYLISAFFVAVLLISNIASSAKIIDLGFSIFGVRMAFDGGTLLFPLSYIFGDILTEVYGYRVSRKLIWTGFGCLILAAAVFFILRSMPGDAEWEHYAGAASYDAILGGMSSGAIVLASLGAYWAGSFSNAVSLSLIKTAMKGRLLFVRTIGSTLIGQLFDTFAFVAVATLLGVFSPELFASLLLTNYLFKCAIEAAMTPATYAAVYALKKAEGVDVYDTDVSFNPFSRK